MVKEILKEFMMIPAPSGYESLMAYALKAHFDKYCDETRIDRIGNCIGLIKGTGKSSARIMVYGHMDSLGFIVRKVEKNGFIQVDRLGGIPEKVLPALSLLVRDENGGWHEGIFGNKAHHATPENEKYKVDLVTSLFIDIGAKSAEEVNALGIYPGCPAVYKPCVTELLNGRLTGTAIDNRGACACLVDIAQKLSENRPPADVYLVGTVWEEFNLRGAMIAARTVKPDIALELDVTLAGDTNDLASRFEDVLGQGPCVQLYSFHGRGTLNGSLPNENLFKLAKTTAEKNHIPLQRFAALGIVTDNAYLQLEGEGVCCLEMGFPARYTHTPVEMCEISDIESLSKLVSCMLHEIDDSFRQSRF